MAFSFEVYDWYFTGDKKIILGKWDTDTTTGELDLSAYFCGKIYHIVFTPKDSSVVADAPTVAETFPHSSDTPLTMLFTSGKSGYFRAEGEGV